MMLRLNPFHRSMIDNGKDKLEWYRTVDAAKLDHLKEMMLQVSLMPIVMLMLCMVLVLILMLMISLRTTTRRTWALSSAPSMTLPLSRK